MVYEESELSPDSVDKIKDTERNIMEGSLARGCGKHSCDHWRSKRGPRDSEDEDELLFSTFLL